MYYQTDEYFNKNIQNYGCNFFSCLKIAELEAVERFGYRFRFSKNLISNIYSDVIEFGYMEGNCWVLRPSSIISYGFDCLTSRDLEVHQVGDDTTWWGWVDKNPQYKNYKYQIIRWETESFQHFTVGDKDGEEIYDPYPNNTKHTVLQRLYYYIGD